MSLIKPFDEPIYVTRPLLPPLEAVHAHLSEIWSARWLTNAGKQHEQLSRAIRDYLDVPEVSLFNNGTIALLAAVRALEMRGDVITTPFTFPATPHAGNPPIQDRDCVEQSPCFAPRVPIS